MSDPDSADPLPTRALDRPGLVALLAALVLLAIIAAASVWQGNRNADALTMARATRRQRDVVVNVLLAAQDAETSQRGYLLTGDPDYLQPLTRAEQVLPGLLQTLTERRPDDAALPAFQQAVRDKLRELRQTVALAEAGDTPAAMALVRTNVGRDSMVEIRQHVANLDEELDAALATQTTTITHGGRLLIAIDVAGLVMVLSLAGLIALGLRSYLTQLRDANALARQANTALERINERLDETVRVRTADLSAANEEIQRFAYIVSHDLRAPLVNIMGFTSELEQAADTLAKHLAATPAAAGLQETVGEDIPEALRFIKSSTSKMDRLINAILKLSREGRRVLAPEPIDMAAMLSTMTESLQHQANAKAAAIEIGTAPGLMADRLAVEQVFTNVVDNALKYLRPDSPGRIRVSGRTEGAMRVYEISDNGRGIAKRDFERIFDLFRRAGDQSVPGEGIGLAHVRALVRRLGGGIECASELGVGTTFTIRLPAVAPQGMEIAA